MARRSSPPDTTIGQRIRDRRKQRNWSVRYAASRAGVAPSTWSRIENGNQSADNRFVLADIATALECPVTELTNGAPAAATDRSLISAQASVNAIRETLLEADLDERPTVEAPPLAELEREVDLGATLYARWDLAGITHRLPDLIRGLHAAAVAGPDSAAALRLMVHTGQLVSTSCKYAGSPAEAWMGAEWARRAAERLEDPVMTGYAAFTRAHAAIGAYKRAHNLAARAADELARQADAEHAPEILGVLLLTCAHTAYATKRTSDGAEYFAEAERLAARTGETTTFEQFFGPTNVRFWRIGAETDGGDPAEAVRIALDTNPAALPVVMRQAMFYLDSSRAFARVRRDKDAVRYMLTAERLAPQLVHASPLAAETARNLRDRAGGSQLRGLCERMGVAD